MSENVVTNPPESFLRRFTRELPVHLDEHELQMYGRMLAEKVKEQELAIDKKKQVMADHNNRIKVITNEIKRLADARAKGEELRAVMCGEKLHGNVIEIVRIDRGEVVDTRPADLKDLQVEMPGMGMPAIPEGFDEGPRGEALGSLADKPADDGEMVTSSVGDQVYTHAGGDDESDVLVCDACGEVVKEGDATALYEGSTIHEQCLPEDAPLADGGTAQGKLVQGYFGTPGGPQPGEDEDSWVDRKLEERALGEEPKPVPAKSAAPVSEPKKKPTRERSKKANADKSKGKRK